MSYADAQVTFHLPEPLTDGEYANLIAIPGVEPWHPYGGRREVLCPYSAAWIAECELRSLGMTYQMAVEAPVTAVATVPDLRTRWDDCADTLREMKVRPWVLDSFILPFQQDCVLFGLDRGSAHIWAPPGSGKTLIALLWSRLVLVDAPTTVVVVKSAATVQWAREARRFVDGIDPWICRPASKTRKKDESLDAYLERAEFPFILVGWANLSAFTDANLDKLGRFNVVFDESHMAKSYRRKRWTPDGDGGLDAHRIDSRSTAAADLAARATHRLCTTATAISNRLWDLWGQLTLVEPQGWGQTAKRFQARYCEGHQNEYGWWCDGMDRARLPELRQRLAFSTISIPYDVSHAQLPPKRREVRTIAADALNKALPGLGVEARTVAKDAQRNSDARHRLTEIRLMQAASMKRTAITDAVRDYMDEGRGKIVVFDGRQRNVDKLGEKLARMKGLETGVNLWAVHGGHGMTERLAALDDYMQHPGPCALVATVQSMGTSLNLHDTDVMIWAMLPYTPEKIAQGEGRGDRLGMTRPLLYLYLVAEGTADERVQELLLSKLDAVEEITPGTRLEAFGGVKEMLARGGKTPEEIVDSILDVILEDT